MMMVNKLDEYHRYQLFKHSLVLIYLLKTMHTFYLMSSLLWNKIPYASSSMQFWKAKPFFCNGSGNRQGSPVTLYKYLLK